VAPDIDLSRALWRKSPHSNNGGACVEVATNLPGLVAVRDSKQRNGPVLTVTRDDWAAFTDRVKAGAFSL
jgi:hypothetical protein